MRKINGLAVVLGAVLGPLSLAHATEVTRLPANNMTANAVSNDPDTGGTTAVFITRQLGAPGGPVDSIFFVVSTPDTFSFGIGTLPKGAFKTSAHAASLKVDTNNITYTTSEGVPNHGVINVNWTATSTTRQAGETTFSTGPFHVLLSGVRTDIEADVTGTVLGSVMREDGIYTMAAVHQAVIIINRN